MKRYSLLTGLVISCALVPIQGVAQAQEATATAAAAATTQQAQLESIVKPTLASCTPSTGETAATSGRIEDAKIDPVKVIPTVHRRAFPVARIAKTLHGIWRGRVQGDHSDVHVDYFWIMDTNVSEGLIIAQRSGKETLAGAAPIANAPKLSYLMCAHDGYSPGTSVPQIHEFTKVSNSTENAAQVVKEATGLETAKPGAKPSELWAELVRTEYFNGLPYVAFAGALFKPIRIETVQSAGGPPETFVGWDAEYRGGGSTKLKYVTGVPTTGSERVQFVGTTTQSGDYLIASPGNGSLWKVEAWPANSPRRPAATSSTTSGTMTSSGWIVDGVDYSSEYNLAFDSVALGPLE